MKVAIVGSRSIDEKHYDLLCSKIPKGTSTVISGGAKGADALAKIYAEENQLNYIEILPDYAKYGRAATIRRNEQIVDMADYVLVFWDGKSIGCSFVMKYCIETDKPLKVLPCH